MESLISFNGELIEEADFGVGFANRSFNYGDGFFESCLFEKGECRLWQFHEKRIASALSQLAFEIIVTPTALAALVLELLMKKGLTVCAARIKIHFFRNNGGLYTPTSTQGSFIISAEKSNGFSINSIGLNVGFAERNYISEINLGFKSTSAIQYVLAGIEKKNRSLDDLILCNSRGEITEMISSNVWWYNDGVVFTASSATGCVNGVAKLHVLEILEKEGIPIKQGAFDPDELLGSSEVFVSNAVQGIRWVEKIDGHYFKSQIAHFLYEAAFR